MTVPFVIDTRSLIEGRMFTPLPRPLTSKTPENASLKCYRKHYMKLPKPRQMLCTDIHVPVKDADKAFMRAWNLLVSHGLRYAASFRGLYGKARINWSGIGLGKWQGCFRNAEGLRDST